MNRTSLVPALLDKAILTVANGVIYAANPRAIAQYRRHIGRFPSAADPRRYSELMLWRKLVDHNPLFIEFTDKLAAKDYCLRRCPTLLMPKTLWTGIDADEIPPECLAGDVFVKSNHGFNFNLRVKGNDVDRRELKRRTDDWLKFVHGRRNYQWAYSKVEPKLFVEEAIGDAEGDLLEFNVRASNGKPILGSVIGHNKLPNQWTAYLDERGQVVRGPKGDLGELPARFKPDSDIARPYAMALEYARELSLGVDYARFDFMWNGSALYGGEITVYPSGGVSELKNAAQHRAVVESWDLMISGFLTTHHGGLKGTYAKALRREIRRRRTQTLPSGTAGPEAAAREI